MARTNPRAAMGIVKKASGKIKTTGKFHGKSNALGHGGRAAQLKARGVPGGVIGNLARAAHAAPGQKNYHGKKTSKKKASNAIPKQELGLALKRKGSKRKSSSPKHTHIHVHFHKGSDALIGTEEENKEMSGMRMKHYKKAHKDAVEGDEKEGDTSTQGKQEDAEEGHEEYKGKKRKHMKGAVCMKCKGAHKTSEHAKKSKKKAA